MRQCPPAPEVRASDEYHVEQRNRRHIGRAKRRRSHRSKKAFIAGTFDKLAEVLPQGAQLRVENLIVKDDQAVVELHSLATAKNGMRFDNRYCWVVYFKNGVIVRIRAYLDSAMVTRLFEENPLRKAS